MLVTSTIARPSSSDPIHLIYGIFRIQMMHGVTSQKSLPGVGSMLTLNSEVLFGMDAKRTPEHIVCSVSHKISSFLSALRKHCRLGKESRPLYSANYQRSIVRATLSINYNNNPAASVRTVCHNVYNNRDKRRSGSVSLWNLVSYPLSSLG